MTHRLTQPDSMDRITARVPDDLLEDLDALVEAGHIDSRSAAVRQGLQEVVDAVDADTCRACGTVVDDPDRHEREVHVPELVGAHGGDHR